MSDRDHFELLPWRTDHSVGRTIYAQVTTSMSHADHLIGVMDTPALATEAVAAHNAARTALPWTECAACGTGWRHCDHDACPVCHPPNRR